MADFDFSGIVLKPLSEDSQQHGYHWARLSTPAMVAIVYFLWGSFI
jgi:hypothetical protein